MSINDLAGDELDAAVRKVWGEPTVDDLWMFGLSDFSQLRPSTSWMQGGPIIERAGIELYFHSGILNMNKMPTIEKPVEWSARIGFTRAGGPTPLIAAMRAFVLSKKAVKAAELLRSKSNDG